MINSNLMDIRKTKFGLICSEGSATVFGTTFQYEIGFIKIRLFYQWKCCFNVKAKASEAQPEPHRGGTWSALPNFLTDIPTLGCSSYGVCILYQCTSMMPKTETNGDDVVKSFCENVINLQTFLDNHESNSQVRVSLIKTWNKIASWKLATTTLLKSEVYLSRRLYTVVKIRSWLNWKLLSEFENIFDINYVIDKLRSNKHQ